MPPRPFRLVRLAAWWFLLLSATGFTRACNSFAHKRSVDPRASSSAHACYSHATSGHNSLSDADSRDGPSPRAKPAYFPGLGLFCGTVGATSRASPAASYDPDIGGGLLVHCILSHPSGCLSILVCMYALPQHVCMPLLAVAATDVRTKNKPRINELRGIATALHLAMCSFGAPIRGPIQTGSRIAGASQQTRCLLQAATKTTFLKPYGSQGLDLDPRSTGIACLKHCNRAAHRSKEP